MQLPVTGESPLPGYNSNMGCGRLIHTSRGNFAAEGRPLTNRSRCAAYACCKTAARAAKMVPLGDDVSLLA